MAARRWRGRCSPSTWSSSAHAPTRPGDAAPHGLPAGAPAPGPPGPLRGGAAAGPPRAGSRPGRGRSRARAAAARAIPGRRRVRRALRPQPHAAPGARDGSASGRACASAASTGGRPRRGSPGRSARWTSARSSTASPAATGGSTPRSSPRGGFPASGRSCCAGASRPALVRDRLCGLWPRWRDALDGLEPAEPAEAHAGERGMTSEDGRRDPQRLPPLLRGARAPRGEELAARAAERPHPPLRQRGDEPVQGRVPRAREAGLHPGRLVAEVRARRGQAQRPRERGRDRAPPHLLRDARQLLVRRLLQEGRDRVRLGLPDPRPRPGRRTG